MLSHFIYDVDLCKAAMLNNISAFGTRGKCSAATNALMITATLSQSDGQLYRESKDLGNVTA